MPVLDALLEEGTRGSIKLYTSALSSVEVAFSASEQKQMVLDEATEQKIDSLWTGPGAVELVEYHDAVGKMARSLIRHAITMGWSIKPPDAIHLATAQWLSIVGLTVDEFHTYDNSLVKYGPIVGFGVMEPYAPQPRML